MSAFLLVFGSYRAGRALLTFSNWNENGSGSITVDRLEFELLDPKKHGAITPPRPICIEPGRHEPVDITETLNLMVGDVARSQICVSIKGTPANAISAQGKIFAFYQQRGYFHAFHFNRFQTDEVFVSSSPCSTRQHTPLLALSAQPFACPSSREAHGVLQLLAGGRMNGTFNGIPLRQIISVQTVTHGSGFVRTSFRVIGGLLPPLEQVLKLKGPGLADSTVT